MKIELNLALVQSLECVSSVRTVGHQKSSILLCLTSGRHDRSEDEHRSCCLNSTLASYILHNLNRMVIMICGLQENLPPPIMSYVKKSKIKWVDSYEKPKVTYAAYHHASVKGLSALCIKYALEILVP